MAFNDNIFFRLSLNDQLSVALLDYFWLLLSILHSPAGRSLLGTRTHARIARVDILSAGSARSATCFTPDVTGLHFITSRFQFDSQ